MARTIICSPVSQNGITVGLLSNIYLMSKSVNNLQIYSSATVLPTALSQFEYIRPDNGVPIAFFVTDDTATLDTNTQDTDSIAQYNASVVIIDGTAQAVTLSLVTSNIVWFYVDPSNAAQTIMLYYNLTLNKTQQLTLTGTPASIATSINNINSQTGGAVLGGNNAFTGTNSFALPNAYSNQTGITAHAGGGLQTTGASLITKEMTNFTVVASSGDSGTFATAAVVGKKYIVTNSGAFPLSVFPFTGGTIDGQTAGYEVMIPVGETVTFECFVAGAWISNLVHQGFQNSYTNPYALSASGTIPAANFANGYIQTESGGALAVTLPTAALLFAELQATNFSGLNPTVFDFIIDNTLGNAGAVTLTLGSGMALDSHSSDTDTLVVVNSTTIGLGYFRMVFTSPNSAVVFRLGTTEVQLDAANNFSAINSFAAGIKTGAAGIQATTPLTTTPVGTVTIQEFSTGKDIVTVLTLTNFIVGGSFGAAAKGVGNIVAAYPAGDQHLELVDSFSSIVLTLAGTAVACDTGLGSVIASGAVSVLDGTATFEDRFTGVAITTAPTGGTAVSGLAGATAGIGTGIALNGAAAVKNVFLNAAGTFNVNNTGNLTASGVIILKWTQMA